MIEVNHTPTKTDQSSYKITGASVDDLIDECMKRIRPQSKEFYKRELKKDLTKHGISLIDRHAGMGSYYTVILNKKL